MDLKKHAGRTRSIWRLASLLLVLGVSLAAEAAPPTIKLPARNPNSTEPWGAYLGRNAHLVIGKQYALQHPFNRVFLDSVDLYTIVEEGEVGDPRRLPEFVRLLRPDITDTVERVLFEIKPDNEQGSKQGREQAARYLAALNSVVKSNKTFSGGTGLDGSLFIEFEDGGVLWQLSWRTPEPGVTLYRWSYRRAKPHTSWQQRADQPQEELSREEVETHGEVVERMLRATYEGGEWPSGVQGRVYRPVDCH